MKHQFHPTSFRHQCEQQQQQQHHDHLERLDQLAQLEQMQLQASLSNQQHYLTIEDLKSTRNSCWLCGCNWLEDHVSLDCPECDGYALSRPCPNCEGRCQQTWTRNISATHHRHKALWTGQCKFQAKQLSEAEQFKAAAQAAASIIATNKQLLYAHPSAATPSSCYSSRPSSAATSDEEPDEPAAN